MNDYSDFKGVHHFYLGLVVVLVGFFLIWVYWIPSVFCELLGLWIILDDYAQHLIKRKKPEYESFLHRKFRIIYRFKIVRDITGFFDNLFGR